MQSPAPLLANAKLVASDEWQEPIWNGPEPRKKHRRFIWIPQRGVGATGSGATGRRKTRPAARLARSLAERPGAAAATTARQAYRTAANRAAPRLYGAT